MERIPISRLSFRRKGSQRGKDKEKTESQGMFDNMTYLR